MSDRVRGFLMMTALAVASAGLFWLLRDHWGHALGFAPYLLFLGCPLMHLFTHHGRGHGHQRPSQGPSTSARRPDRPAPLRRV